VTEPLLAVRALTVEFGTGRRTVHAVNGVDLDLARGETLGIVGESGSGKTVTGLALMGLAAGRIVRGQIRFEGRDLRGLSEAEMTALRGNRIAMIFQEPMSALNPVMRIGSQIAETLRRHRGAGHGQAWDQAVAWLERVGIAEAGRRARQYPHQLSGGMRQRAMIAMALACEPVLLIADEPTTALDVTIQAQILDMLSRLQRSLGLSMIMITHDLGVVAETADRIAVMYAGAVVETGPTRAVLAGPHHPYTAALLRAIPDAPAEGEGRRGLAAIPGTVPDLRALPPGCAFAERCAHVQPRCRTETPPAVTLSEGRAAWCWLHAA